MPKKIVVFSDGTGKEGGRGANTNVYRLFNMVLDRTPAQIAFYDRGLGTGWRKITGLVGGAGISKNIRDCYEFLFDNFESGDEIFLFGFSRGATTVRSLSAFIEMFGILPKSRRELIKRAYGIYRIRDVQKRKRQADAFLSAHHTMWTRVKFLGVWDTVAALGLPLKRVNALLNEIPLFRHRYHNLALSKGVDNAYHALAIDEERKTFHPKIWDREIEAGQTMRQVWFCGMHSDVGGGYDACGLSDIALQWMVEKATKHGLEIYPGHQVEVHADPDGRMHDSRGGFLSGFYRRRCRSWNPRTHGDPVVHRSVEERTLNRDNEQEPAYAPWILSLPHEVEP